MRRTEHVHYGNVMCSMIRYVNFLDLPAKNDEGLPSRAVRLPRSFTLDVLARVSES